MDEEKKIHPKGQAEALIEALRKQRLHDGNIAPALKKEAEAGRISQQELTSALATLERAKAEDLYGMKFI